MIYMSVVKVNLFHTNVVLCTGVSVFCLDRSGVSLLFHIVVCNGFCADVRHYCLYEPQLCSYDDRCWRAQGMVEFTNVTFVFNFVKL